MPFSCIFGCNSPGTVLHVFPNPKKNLEHFNTWASIVKTKIGTLTETEVYRKKRICDIHFLPKHKNRNNRLSALALPLLHLPDGCSNLTGVLDIIKDKNPPYLPPETTIENYDNVHQCENVTSVESPTATSSALDSFDASSTALTSSLAVINKKTPSEATFQHYDITHSDSFMPLITAVTSCALDSFDNDHHCEYVSPVASPAATSTADSFVEHGEVSASIVLQDHNYFVKRPKRSHPIQSIGRQEGTYKQKVRNLQHTVYSLRRKCRSFKARLARARKRSTAFNLITKDMTQSARLFVHMQLQTNKRPAGRRFSIEEKVLSLALYKKSPNYYRLLKKHFTLPSLKTMRQLLSKVIIFPGDHQQPGICT